MKTAAGQRLEFKEVTEPSELEQVHRLNYRTFVEEIPQHGGNAAGVLVDRFEPWSTYFIARLGERVVGMIALNEHRPFSLDDKLPNLDEYLPQLRRARVCELRLLAVEPEHRNGMVFRGLIREIA